MNLGWNFRYNTPAIEMVTLSHHLNITTKLNKSGHPTLSRVTTILAAQSSQLFNFQSRRTIRFRPGHRGCTAFW